MPPKPGFFRRVWSSIAGRPKATQASAAITGLPAPTVSAALDVAPVVQKHARNVAFGGSIGPTDWPTGAGSGAFGPPTPPTLTSAGYLRTSASGTAWNSGVISGQEDNAELSIREWARIANDMERSDPTIQICVEGFLQTVRTAKWHFEPANDSDEARFYARFFDDMWSRMRLGWADQQISYMARFALTGFRYVEQIEVVKLGIVEPDGERHLRTFIDHFADCEPHSHLSWVSTDGGRTLAGVEQIDESGAFGNRRVDRLGNLVPYTTTPRTSADKLLLFVAGKTGQNWDGNGGLMRAVYGPFQDKQNAQNIRAVALDRWSSPSPLLQSNLVQAEAEGYLAEAIKTARSDGLAQAKRFAAGAETAMDVASFITVTEFGGSFDAKPHNETIEMCDKQILMGMLQPFLGMPLGDGAGSRVLSAQAAAFFARWTTNVLDTIARTANGVAREGAGAVGRIMTANWPHVHESMFPKLVHTGLRADDFQELAGVLGSWQTSGLLGEPEITRDIFDRMGMQVSDEALVRIAAMSPQNQSKGNEATPISTAGQPGPGRTADAPEGGEDPVFKRKPRVELSA